MERDARPAPPVETGFDTEDAPEADAAGSGPPAQARVAAVLARAAENGLTSERSDRIAVSVSPRLVARAKARTGLGDAAALIEFALANIAVEDEFASTFRAVRASADPGLDLEF